MPLTGRFFSPSPAPQNGGAPGGDGSSGLSSNPFTLPATTITEITTDAQALAARVHRVAGSDQFNVTELWYFRYAPDNAWHLSPMQPLMNGEKSVRISSAWNQPSTLEFTLPNNEGLLTPENKNSPYNYQGLTYDPLLDESRKILLRVGARCYDNLVAGLGPTFSSNDASATLSASASRLTDGILSNYAATSPADCVLITPHTATTADFVIPVSTPDFVSDSFTGTGPLDSHIGERGASWTIVSDASGFFLDAAMPGGVYETSNFQNSRYYVASGTPPTSDYTVRATLKVFGPDEVGILGRMAGASVGNYSGYGVLTAGATYRLYRFDNEVGTVLASGGTVADGDVIELSFNGFIISVNQNGTQILTATDTHYSAAGQVGVVGIGNGVTSTTGTHLRDFSATSAITQPVRIQHCVARFGSKSSLSPAFILPTAVQFSFSLDGINYTSPFVRPVGGEGSSTTTPGDWDDNYDGIAVETSVTNVEALANYVRIRVHLPSSGVVAMDEIAVYGSQHSLILGRNRFVGYLGDIGQIDAQGYMPLMAVDLSKRLGDNNQTAMTAVYEQGTNAVPVELADIAYSLLTSSAYWPNNTPYTAPCVGYPTDIGWQHATNYTGFAYPLWQGVQNSILGYIQRLFRTIGWWFFIDGNGVAQAKEAAYIQSAPDRLFTANSLDGNGDVRHIKRQRNGKNLRNMVEVTSGKATDAGSGLYRQFDPTSVARYDVRMTRLTDPAAITPALRQQVAKKFLRDYAWNIQSLSCQMQPDFDTCVGQIHAFRAIMPRVSMFAKASSVEGFARAREMWSLRQLTEVITTGDWWAEAQYLPFTPVTTEPPTITSIDAGSGGTPLVFITYEAITDPKVAWVRIYYSTISDAGPWLLYESVSPSVDPTAIAGLTAGQTYWIYLTTVDIFGQESIPSMAVMVIPGSSAIGEAEYQINDLSVGWVNTGGPDAQGYYSYQFYATWTSPPGGFTQDRVHFAIDALPDLSVIDTEAGWPLSSPKWDWWDAHRIPAGMEWDRTTPGLLDANWVLRWPSSLSGHRLYFRMWVSCCTRSWGPPGGIASNYTSTTIP